MIKRSYFRIEHYDNKLQLNRIGLFAKQELCLPYGQHSIFHGKRHKINGASDKYNLKYNSKYYRLYDKLITLNIQSIVI